MIKANVKVMLAVMALCGACTVVVAADETGVKNEIVVTATRTEALVKNVPSDTVIINQDEIQKREYKTLKDALQTVPGIVLEADAHGGQNVNIRGAAARHTLLLMDGKRITADLTKTRANVLNFDRLSMEDVERIEIVKGPNSALYGSEAMGGVINIITKKAMTPSVRWNNEVSIRDGAEGTAYNTVLDVRSGQQGKWNSAISFGKRKNIAAHTETGGEVAYEGTREPIHLETIYNASANHSFKLTYDYIKEDLFKNNVRSLPVMHIYTPETLHTKTQMASLEYKGRFDKTDVTSRIHYNKAEDNFSQNLKLVATNPILAPSINHKGLATWDRVIHKDLIFETQFDTAVNDKHLLSYGFAHHIEDAEGTRIGGDRLKTVWTETKDVLQIVGRGVVPKSLTQVGKHAKIKTTSAFIQDEWQPSERWLITPAIRFDSSNVFGDNWSPKVGATYTIDDRTRVKANVGRGYSAPGITELYHAWEMYTEGTTGVGKHGWWWQGNPDLMAETSTNFDISLEKDYRKTSLKATYFWNRIKNYIDYGFLRDAAGNIVTHTTSSGVNDVYTYFNLGSVQLQGVELSVNQKMNDRWSAFANYMYLDSKDRETGHRLNDRAQQTVSAGITYNHKDWDVSLWGNAYIHYLDLVGTRQIGKPEMKTLSMWNLLVSKQVQEGMKVYFGVNNFLNEKDTIRDIDGPEYRFGINMTF